MDNDGEWSIRLVEPERADAVAVLRVTIPGVFEAYESRYYLADSQPRLVARTLKSVAIGPGGRVTEVGTVVSEENVELIVCSYGNGRTAVGRGGGSRTSVHFTGRRAGVVVHLSISWTARDGSRGEFDEEVIVPWPGAVRAELGGGTWVEAEIVPATTP